MQGGSGRFRGSGRLVNVMERVLAGEHDLTHACVGWGTGTGSTYLPVSIFW